MEGLGGQRCEETVTSSVKTKFRQLPKVSEDIEMELSLFRSTMILSAVESWIQKQLRMASGSEKSTP